MNLSEFLPFAPAILFVAVSVFAAWRISRTGSVATPASPDLAKQPDAAPSKSTFGPAPTDSKSQSADPFGWRLQPERTFKLDVSYSERGVMQVIHHPADPSKASRQTTH